ncbi:LysR family transcriptional regulator [Blastococcus sp. SYSU D00669]
MAGVPDVESLQLLVLVDEHGSLTGAATVLGISQPSASKRLSALERRLGLQLVDRSRRGSALTAEGAVVAGWAARVLAELAVLTEGAAALRRHREAELSLAASLTIAEHLLPGWIGTLRRDAPDLHVGLQVLNSTRVCELARHDGVDVGFIESPGPAEGLDAVTVGSDRLVLVVAPGHEWAGRTAAVTGAELAATPLITREAGSGTRDTADRALRATGLPVARPLLELGSGTAVRTAVVSGAGPALLSELVVAADLVAGALVEVPTTGLELRRTLRAVWRAGTRPTGPAADLLTMLTRRPG